MNSTHYHVFKTTLGTLEDSTLTLYDADGHYFDDNDDVSDDDYSSMLEWTAQNSGTYYIVVGGFGQGSFGLSAHEGKGPKANQLKLQQLSSADARLKFAEDSSEVQDENQSDYDLLTDNYEELDFGYVADWGFDL